MCIKYRNSLKLVYKYGYKQNYKFSLCNFNLI